MKKIIVILCLVFTELISFGKPCKKDSRSVKQVTIMAMNMFLRTDHDISCSGLFDNRLDSFLINDTDKLQMILKFIANSVPDSNTQNNLDTRAHLHITYQSGKVDTLCISGNGRFRINDQPRLFKSMEMINFIQSLLSTVEKEEWER